jgi:hypothetical protein
MINIIIIINLTNMLFGGEDGFPAIRVSCAGLLGQRNSRSAVTFKDKVPLKHVFNCKRDGRTRAREQSPAFGFEYVVESMRRSCVADLCCCHTPPYPDYYRRRHTGEDGIAA